MVKGQGRCDLTKHVFGVRYSDSALLAQHVNTYKEFHCFVSLNELTHWLAETYNHEAVILVFSLFLLLFFSSNHTNSLLLLSFLRSPPYKCHPSFPPPPSLVLLSLPNATITICLLFLSYLPALIPPSLSISSHDCPSIFLPLLFPPN